MSALFLRCCSRVLMVVAISITSVDRCGGQPADDALFPPPKQIPSALRDAVTSASVDVNTRWAFRALSPVTLHSPIIRLGDVVRPLDPDMSGWQRIRQSPVGLLPLNGTEMTIDRQRLSQAIVQAEATACAIDWIGPEKISIRYESQKGLTESQPTGQHSVNDSSRVVQTAYKHSQRASTNSVNGTTTSQAQPSARESATPLDEAIATPLDEAIATRLAYWIQLAIKRQYAETYAAHAITIDTHQVGLRALQSARGIDHVGFESESVGSGTHKLLVTGRGTNGPVPGEVQVTLKAHPLAVVPNDSFRRGYRLQSRDLTTRPIPAEDWNDQFVADQSELIGMELRTTVRQGQPIMRTAFGLPILILRGDIVEIQVVGGGIRITTNGKAMEDGSESDLIEVETTNPRKRLIARVAGPGIVQLVTRAPRIQP